LYACAVAVIMKILMEQVVRANTPAWYLRTGMFDTFDSNYCNQMDYENYHVYATEATHIV
jgi:hypothetical protein